MGGWKVVGVSTEESGELAVPDCNVGDVDVEVDAFGCSAPSILVINASTSVVDVVLFITFGSATGSLVVTGAVVVGG